jgi:glycosyltransferase involved in cell wall biosynthesis
LINSRIPLVSFVIPTLNRERSISACLESIANQDYKRKEIIVVDGGSNDRTVEIASKFAKVIVDLGSLGNARKKGIHESSGEIIGIFDSDTSLPTKRWLSEAVEALSKDNRIGILWPLQVPPKSASLTARCYSGFWRNRVNLTKGALPGGNSLILRKAYDDVGGFSSNVDFGEDFELTSRIISKGYSVLVFQKPIIHDTMYSVKEFLRKQIWGASSLFTTSSTNKNMELLAMSMTWKDASISNKRKSIVTAAITEHFLIIFPTFFNGIFREKDFSLLLLPLLMYIRVGVYSVFYVTQKL